MKRFLFPILVMLLSATSVYAADAETVNDLPPCNSFDNAIFREVYKNFSGESFGRVRKGENGNFFVTVGGTPMEFAIEGKTVQTIGLKDYTDHQTLGEIGQEHLYDFESPIQEETKSDYEIFNSEDTAPSMPYFTEGQSSAQSSKSSSTAPQEDSSFSIPDELFTGSTRESAKSAIILFYAESAEDAQFRLTRWIASRPLISEMVRSGDTLVGKVKGIVNEYAITINSDGTLTLDDTAWMEFPQWSALKR